MLRAHGDDLNNIPTQGILNKIPVWGAKVLKECDKITILSQKDYFKGLFFVKNLLFG